MHTGPQHGAIYTQFLGNSFTGPLLLERKKEAANVIFPKERSRCKDKEPTSGLGEKKKVLVALRRLSPAQLQLPAERSGLDQPRPAHGL